MKTVFGTYEWAEATFNIINGCSHNCKYCFSKEMAIRFKRKEPESWPLEELNIHQFNSSIPHRDGIVMFPSTHDITPDNLQYTLVFLSRILENNNRVLIVTKPHYECIKRICETCAEYRDKILFRFTIGSTDDEALSFWEPGAPSYAERKQSLIYAFSKGFQTSVSCEPMLDANVENVVLDLQGYVTDAIWIGKMNFVMRRLKMNGCLDAETEQRASKLLQEQDDRNIIDLYNRLKNNPIIKWKESIKKVVGLNVASSIGQDV